MEKDLLRYDLVFMSYAILESPVKAGDYFCI